MAECGSVSQFPNLKVNRRFLPFLCSGCCCPLLPCRKCLSNVTSEPHMWPTMQKVGFFYAKFLARKAKVDSIAFPKTHTYGLLF